SPRARRRRSSGTTRSSRPISASTTVGAAEPAPRGGTGPTPSASAPSASRDGALLEVRGVEVAYGAGVLALQGVSLAVHPGEIVALIGAKGAGERTLLMAVGGVVARPRGASRFAGWAVRDLESPELVL